MKKESLIRLLNSLITKSENEYIEFKLNNDDPKTIGEYLSALSNSASICNQPFGYLIFGVEDNTKELIGTKISILAQKKGNEDLEHWLAKSLLPCPPFTIYEFEYNDKKIVIIRIPAASGIPVKFQNTAYVRIGSYKKPLYKYPEKESLIWNSRSNIKFESKVVMYDVLQSEISQYLNLSSYFELTNQPFPDSLTTIIDKFKKERFIVDNDNGNYNITVLGAILFAQNLQDYDMISRKSVRLIIYSGSNKLNTKKEITGVKGYAVGFTGLIEYIIDYLPSNEILEKSLRKEVSLYPDVAIRELVANAIIHQDLSISGTGPMIEIFSDRIEITNPGKPLIDILRFIDSNPISRNEKLASFMRRIGFCEERGSGIDKVISSCEGHQLPGPNFITDNTGYDYTKSILYAPKDFKRMDKVDRIRACYQHCCLKYVSNEFMTNTSLRERFNISKNNHSTPSRIISDTMEEGLVIPYDSENISKKHAKYIPFWTKLD